MKRANQREQLFDSIVRLRRAERESPADRDIAAVRSRLEEELGDTVSRRLAAKILGVSHTALARWIKAGDVPLVYTSNGREGVPVAALLELADAVALEDAPAQERHRLEPVMRERRERALALRTEDLLPRHSSGTTGHARAELRSLACHRALADRVDREMVNEALHVLWKWRDQGKIDARYAEQWEEVLSRPLVEVRQLISDDGPFARDLRQNSPFAGMLSEPERRRILEMVR